MRICRSCAQISFLKAQSSAFKTNCLMRALIFSGRMQKILPISFGFLHSIRRMCKIALTFPKKFFDSYVQGCAIYHVLISGTFCFGRGASNWTSISWLFATQKAVSLSIESVILFSPCKFAGNTPQYEATSCKFWNSNSTSHQSGMNHMCWSSIDMMLQKMKVV